ncbi:hypothetical protein GW17_00016527 [Ensete ventricosum]|nr:hypothetical protein GW17_00016527 [Ensete ventricosum]
MTSWVPLNPNPNLCPHYAAVAGAAPAHGRALLPQAVAPLGWRPNCPSKRLPLQAGGPTTLAGGCPCRRPNYPCRRLPLRVATLKWTLVVLGCPYRGLAMAGRPCRGPSRGRPPLQLVGCPHPHCVHYEKAARTCRTMLRDSISSHIV